MHRNVEQYTILQTEAHQPTLSEEEDKKLFVYTKSALEVLGFTNNDIIDIFRVIAIVLKLGNLQYVPCNNIDGTEGCSINNDYGKFSTILCKFVFDNISHWQNLILSCFFCFRTVWGVWATGSGAQMVAESADEPPGGRRDHDGFECDGRGENQGYIV